MTSTIEVGLYVFVSTILGTIAVTASTINVVGGFLITDRMLRMFRRREPRRPPAPAAEPSPPEPQP